MNMRRVDLNLFRVFEAVMKHGSIVGASRALSITPSAVSHALSRLREALGDQLFVVGEGGMVPTPRAQELAPHVRGGLDRIDSALQQEDFEPGRAVRTFRIAMSDYAAVTLLPALVASLAKRAPAIDLRIFPFSRVDTVRQLDDGRLDLVVGWFGELPERMRRARLWEDVETVVARAGHPLAQREVTRADLVEYPHVVVELTGSGDQYDAGFLEERGVFRRVWVERVLLDIREDGETVVGRAAISVPHYAAVLPIIERTDMLATLPRTYVADAIARGTVVSLPLPYEPIIGTLDAAWHQRNDQDLALAWLVGVMGER